MRDFTLKNFDAAAVLKDIREADLGEIDLMEVCGTHTMAIAKSGIKRMLPENIRLLSGPGCPVCVTPAEAIDAFLDLSLREHVRIATYGDMIRVPGSVRGDNLRRRMACGARVDLVYSPMDALDIAAAHPEDEVIFLGAGFETTAPGTAAAVKIAHERKLRNFSIFPLLRTVEPALRALAEAPDFKVQGLLCPGHVAVVLGEKGFRFLPEELRLPAVISGFEPEDILLSVHRLLRQIEDGTPRLENTYTRAVAPEGNPLAIAMMNEIFMPSDELWRGLGFIPGSGLTLRPEYAAYNALQRFDLQLPKTSAPTACRCGEVICGKLSPAGCPLFGRACTPEDPMGPCMVSSEGACAAAYKYQDIED